MHLVSVLNVFLNPQESSAWTLLLVSMLFLFAFMIWINSYKISLFSDKLTYKSFLHKVSEVNYNKIIKVEIIPGAHGSIAFNVHSNNRSKPIIISYNMFNKGTIHGVLNELVEKSPNIELNSLANQIKEKDFKHINRAAIRNILIGSIWLMIIFAILGLINHFR